jgi:hypothetical protein
MKKITTAQMKTLRAIYDHYETSAYSEALKNTLAQKPEAFIEAIEKFADALPPAFAAAITVAGKRNAQLIAQHPMCPAEAVELAAEWKAQIEAERAEKKGGTAQKPE